MKRKIKSQFQNSFNLIKIVPQTVSLSKGNIKAFMLFHISFTLHLPIIYFCLSLSLSSTSAAFMQSFRVISNLLDIFSQIHLAKNCLTFHYTLPSLTPEQCQTISDSLRCCNYLTTKGNREFN